MIKKACLICAVMMWLALFLLNSPIESQRLGASPLELEVVPSGPNFLIRDNTGKDTIAGKPAVAFDQTNFLLGWTEDRDLNNNFTNIYAARVSQTGTVIDPARIPVSTQVNQEVGPPSVIFDGTQYLMVWAAKRNDVYELYAARILPDGTVLDPGGVVLTSGGDPLQYRKIGLAFDGVNTLVVWRTSNSNIRGARISTVTNIHNIDNPAGFPIASLGAHYYPSVAFDGNVFLVTWHDGRNDPWENLNIYGARVTKDGAVLDPDGFVICDEAGNQDQQTVGFNGQSFWVVWFDQRPNNSSIHGSLYGARVSAGGSVLDTPAIKIAERARGQMPPQINCQGSNCLVVWNVEYDNLGENFRLTDVYARRLTQDGQVLDPQAIPVSTTVGHQFGPVIGYGAGRYLVAWNDSTGMRNYEGAIWGQILVEQEQNQSNNTSKKFSLAAPEQLPGLPGAMWTQETAPVTSYASDGIAFSADNSQAFGTHQRVIFQNGSWQSEYPYDQGYIWASWGDHPNNLWIGGWTGGIQHFNGATWENSSCPALSNHIITGMWGTSSGDVWATADTGRLAARDKDQPFTGLWQEIITDTPFDLEDIWGISESNVYAVGERGTILHYTGTTWQPVANVPTGQTLNAIWGSGPDDIFAVGDWGAIIHYDGTQWSLQTNNSIHHLFDVWGFNGEDVYAAGFSGTILHYDGTAWTPETTGSDQDLLSVWGIVDLSVGKKIVWASGNGQTILKSDEDVVVTHLFLPITTRSGE